MGVRSALQIVFHPRTLGALTLIALASGVPLWVWFAADPAVHAAKLPSWGWLLRGVHAASSSWLVLGVVVHGIGWSRQHASKLRARRSGAVGLVVTGAVAVTGAMVAQSTASARLWRMMGLGEPRALDAVLLLHVFIAALAVVAVWLHWHRTASEPDPYRWPRAGVAVGVTALLAVVWRLAPPGAEHGWWHVSPTVVTVPPLPLLWAWTLMLAAMLWLRSSGR